MIIDMHYHLDERMETMDRLLAQMDRHHIDRVALIAQVVDPFHVEGIAERLAHLVRNLLTGFWYRVGLAAYESTVTKSGKFSLLGKTYPIYELPDNRIVADAMKAYPARFYGWFLSIPQNRTQWRRWRKIWNPPAGSASNAIPSGTGIRSAALMMQRRFAARKACRC